MILYFGYHAAKLTKMMSSEVMGSNSEKTSSHSLLSYVPNDLHQDPSWLVHITHNRQGSQAEFLISVLLTPWGSSLHTSSAIGEM